MPCSVVLLVLRTRACRCGVGGCLYEDEHIVIDAVAVCLYNRRLLHQAGVIRHRSEHRGCKTKRVATAAAQMATAHWAVRLLTVAADEKGLVCATGADVYEKAIGR